MEKFTLILISFILLAGCSISGQSQQSKAEVKNNPEAVFEIPAKEKYPNNPQAADDRELLKVGDRTEDENGQLTLEAIKEVEKFKQAGPVKVMVKDVKVMNYTPSPDLIDYFHAYTHNEMNFNYIKFTVAIKNTGKQTVNFAPVDLLETNTGEKKDFNDDFYLEHLTGSIKPGEEKVGNMGFVLNETDISDLQSIKIKTSNVLSDKKDSIHGPTTFKIEL
ncbi:hypothetical protein SAMN04487936_101539 [Halobacillus dabanensis]|uniref:DUF4352 domain-containing protein n=1 Tax=Halobacillus dabanensis TaxID=240302 RepID=A0A1I3Q6S2_HALDA|nr:hypothetical protein [Halobacillus dabanensis]SFJ28816.1 hypothetical protein SAMN04487936_101539 [Halobacillus dabanensis]